MHNKFTLYKYKTFIFFYSVVISCGKPAFVPNSMRFGSNFTLENSVHYQCYPGYKLTGPGQRTCQSTGAWSGDTPSCNGKYI